MMPSTLLQEYLFCTGRSLDKFFARSCALKEILQEENCSRQERLYRWMFFDSRDSLRRDFAGDFAGDFSGDVQRDFSMRLSQEIFT